jgi:hypothetical protein
MSAMRIGVMLCLLLAGVAFCTEPVTLPDSAGQTRADNATDRIARQLDLARLGLPAKYPATYFRDTTPARPVVRLAAGPDSTAMPIYRTSVSDTQQFLAKLLPGTMFFRVVIGIPVYPVFFVRFADGQTFHLEEMYGILDHVGISFDSVTLNTAAKLAVLFACCGQRVATEPESAQWFVCGNALSPRDFDSLAFPSIDFRSFERGLWRSPGGTDWDGVWVDCVIAGTARRLYVAMRTKESPVLVPIFVTGPGVNMHFI